MPRGDRTGPRGLGPRSGRGAGYPNWVPPSYSPVSQVQEQAGLKDEAEWLKGQLEEINRRIADLERKE